MPDYYGHILDPNHVQNNQQTARSDSETDSVETGDASSRTDLDWSKLSHDRERSLNHRVKAKSSILCLIVDDDCLIAGLEGGDIVAWSLDTFEQILTIHAHSESVLSLYLSQDANLLFSSGSDSIINVWSNETFERLYSIYSHHDVGDLFCVVYSSNLRTIFCGSQNQSIQWYDLEEKATGPLPESATHPANRKHRFFDSVGPGGITTPRRYSLSRAAGGETLSFDKSHYKPYAHDSYVYCMVLARGLFHNNSGEEVLVTGAGDGAIKLWNITKLEDQGLQELFRFSNPDSSVLALVYNDTFLYCGLSDGKVHIYNLDSRQLIQKISVGSGDVTAIQVVKNVAFYGTSTGLVKQFNSDFEQTASWLSNHGKILASSVAVQNSRAIYMTGGNDDTVAFWDVSDLQQVPRELLPHTNDELQNSLRNFVAFRTVAANSRFVADCNEAVTYLRKLFTLFHAKTELLAVNEGLNPVVYARFEASPGVSNFPQNILFYGHYDVVDAEYNAGGSDELWKSDPFVMSPRNGYYYGRGVSDNKGPILAAIYAVAELTQKQALRCNVTFLIEGEEEAGSRGLIDIVRRNKSIIGDIDWILLANSYWLDDTLPCLTYGMRGVIHAKFTVRSNLPDRHSGIEGKAGLNEPLKDLTVLLGSLVGPTGTKVNIPGFYDTISPASQAEKDRYSALTKALLPRHPEIKDSYEFTESLVQRWREPNLTYHKIDVPDPQTAVTISQAAEVALSIRIVPEQDAEKVSADLLKFMRDKFASMGSTNKLDARILSKADAWLGDPDNELFQTLDSAIAEVWSAKSDRLAQFQTVSTGATNASRGSDTPTGPDYFPAGDVLLKPLYIREGGSIPAISFLEREFHAPAAMFPCGQASDNAHLDNERIRVENLHKARDIFKQVFRKLSKAKLANGKP